MAKWMEVPVGDTGRVFEIHGTEKGIHIVLNDPERPNDADGLFIDTASLRLLLDGIRGSQIILESARAPS